MSDELKVETPQNVLASLEEVSVSFGRGKNKKNVLHDISLKIYEGEILGLAGESGSGKSTIAKTLLGMVKTEKGLVELHTSKPQMVFQDPYSSLNPAKKIGWIMQEPLRLNTQDPADVRKKKVMDMLHEVGLDGDYYKRRPSELSGGQRQRICIGTALMTEPSLLIADEPVSALDVTIQAQVLALLENIHRSKNLSILFISHDLRTMYNFCDRILILQGGRIIEEGAPRELYRHPREDYTKLLLQSAGIG